MLDPDGVITNWNPGAERIKGYRSEEIIGQAAGDPNADYHPPVSVSRRLTTIVLIDWNGTSQIFVSTSVQSRPGKETTVSKLSTTAAFAAILVAAMPAAYAQTNVRPETRVAATGSGAHTVIMPDQIRASKMLGSTVYDMQNRNIGSVKDLVLDRDGRVDSVVIDVGSFLGMGGKYVAVNLNDIKTDNNRLTLDRSKEQLQKMASYELEDKNTGAGTTASPVTGGQLGR